MSYSSFHSFQSDSSKEKDNEHNIGIDCSNINYKSIQSNYCQESVMFILPLCDSMPQSILFVTFHFLFIIQIFNRQIMMFLYCYTSSCFRFARRLLRWSSDAFIEREMHNQNLKGFSLVSLMCGQMQLPAKFRLS